MLSILQAIGVAAGLYFLHLSGPNEPAWLPYAVIALAIYCVGVIGFGFQYTINQQPIQHDADEHRNNAI